MSGLKTGNPEAFRKLVDTYRARVYNTALGLLQDAGAAEDICQEVFITVFQSVMSFNGRSQLATWIYRITVNKCLDHLRSGKRKKRKGVVLPLQYSGTAGNFREPGHFEHPGIVAERREFARYLFAAIEQLPEKQKTAFILAHVEELPQKEIAGVMGLSLKAVESLLQRAKARLRQVLGDIYPKE